MNRYPFSIAIFVLACCAFQARAQSVNWKYNGQAIAPDTTIEAPEGKNLNARDAATGALVYSFATPANNGYNVFLSRGHFTTNPTAVRDQVLLISNPGSGQATWHRMYHATGTVYSTFFYNWIATIPNPSFNKVPGKDIVVWTSESIKSGGNRLGARDALHLVSDVPGLVVDTQYLPVYLYTNGAVHYASWAYQLAIVNVNGRSAIDVYFTGPNPNRAFEYGYRPQGILRVNFNNGSRTWIQ